MGAASSSVNEMQAMIILYMNFLQKYEKILCLDNIVTIFEFAFPTMRYSVEDSRIHYGSDNEDELPGSMPSDVQSAASKSTEFLENIRSGSSTFAD